MTGRQEDRMTGGRIRRLPRLIALTLLLGATTAPLPTRKVIPLPGGFGPSAIFAADFNGDGKMDVAPCGENQQLVVFTGDGRGGLRPVSQSARCGANPSNMVSADLNGDGKIDIAISNHDTDYLTVLFNDGAAHFTARQVHVHSNPHPHTVAAADVNGDHRLDLITDSWAENRLTLLLADGHGGWQSPGTPIEVGRKPYNNVIAADLDGDGHVDLVMPNSGFDTVCILFADGHGHFAHAPQSPIVAGPTPFYVTVADVNGDGRPDIVVANYSGHATDTSRDGITWIRNDGNRRFTAFPQRIANGRYTSRVAAGDLNGDGIADVAFTSTLDNAVGILYGSRSGPRPGPRVPTMPNGHTVALADLDGDGRADMLVISEQRDELLVILSR